MRTGKIYLSDVAKFIRGITFKPTDLVPLHENMAVVCMRTKNVQKDLDESDLITIPRKFVKRKEQFLKEGDILVSTANSWELVGKCCWVPKLDYKATAGGFISILRSNEKEILPRYLYYWLASGKIQFMLRHCGRQTTNISNLAFDRALNLGIPVPSLEEQKRIATILDKADAIHRKRRQAIQLSDEFLRSVFLDMFGDPVSNPKNWDQKQIESTIEDIKPGWSIKGNNRDRMPGEWGVLKVSAVTSGRFLPEECKVVAIKGLKREMVKPRKGDLLFTRANTRELVAATCLVERDHNHVFLPDKIWKIIPKQNVLQPEFLKFVLSNPRFRDKIREQATGTSGSMLNVSQVKIKEMIIPVPPVAFQEKFSEIVWKIYKIRNQVGEGIQNAIVLFNSITQRAFRGEL